MAAKPPERPGARVSRRDLLKGAGVVAAATGAGSGAAEAQPAPAAVRREALETLSAAEADVLEAFCARLIPSDETGPGARRTGAAGGG